MLTDNGKIGVGDLPRVRRADAIDLMVHHLMIAAAYYEATPDDDTDAAFRAFSDALLDQCGVLGKESPDYAAGREFWAWLKFGHDKIKDELKDD